MTALSLSSPSPMPMPAIGADLRPRFAKLTARMIRRRRRTAPRGVGIPVPVEQGVFTVEDLRQFVMVYCAAFTAVMILVA